MTIEVRRARPEEYEEAGRVVVDAYREFVPPGESGWPRYLRRIADVASRALVAPVFVAVENGRVLGSVTVEVDERIEDEAAPLAKDEVKVRMLGVRPDARRRGIATALLAEVEEIARRAGRSRITLATTGPMRAAQETYERLGYRRVEDRVFPDGSVVLEYEREVPARAVRPTPPPGRGRRRPP
jgi:ribosomal protein S18 acetylase RimI-like enzyme